jgi:DNA-directed RNA polymerase beta subunit
MYVDNSLMYTKDENSIVDKIVHRETGDIPFVKIKLKSYRPVNTGDKFSNRQGCKGTSG